MLSDCCKSADNDKVDAVAVQDINDGCCMQGLRFTGQFTPTDGLHITPRLDLSIPVPTLSWASPRIEPIKHLVVGINGNESHAQLESGAL